LLNLFLNEIDRCSFQLDFLDEDKPYPGPPGTHKHTRRRSAVVGPSRLRRAQQL
jgi:hypothetical protein